MLLITIKKILIVLFLLNTVLLTSCEYRESYFVKIKKLEEQIDSLKGENVQLHNLIVDNHNRFVEFIKENKKGDVIDLFSQKMQKIGDGFYIAELITSENPDGVNLSGRLINSTSLIHKNICFKITIDGKSKELSIPVVSAGCSSKFTIHLPNAFKGSKNAVVKYLSSSVSFYK